MTERRTRATKGSAGRARGLRFESEILEKARVRTAAIIEQVNVGTAFLMNWPQEYRLFWQRGLSATW